jgi:ribonuclease BN (tRNA processing enzyme)
VRLTVIGCSGSYPSVTGPASCYLLEHDDHRLVLDLGNGSFGPLQSHVDVLDDAGIHGVVLSHLHADHCLDLCSMHVARVHRPAGPMSLIPVLAPSGANARLSAAAGVAVEPGLSRQFDFLPHRPGSSVRIGPFTIDSARMVHPVEAYAIKVTAGSKSIVYSGDTGATDALVDLARSCDVALFEASWTEPRTHEAARPQGLHLSGREAGQHARRAGVGRLILTHVVPWSDAAAIESEARTVFDGEILMAAPGMTVTI